MDGCDASLRKASFPRPASLGFLGHSGSLGAGSLVLSHFLCEKRMANAKETPLGYSAGLGSSWSWCTGVQVEFLVGIRHPALKTLATTGSWKPHGLSSLFSPSISFLLCPVHCLRTTKPCCFVRTRVGTPRTQKHVCAPPGHQRSRMVNFRCRLDLELRDT